LEERGEKGWGTFVPVFVKIAGKLTLGACYDVNGAEAKLNPLR
jgi:hypothetical protein